MSLKILGVGAPRTGTSSLKVALEMLGYGKCAHMQELFGNPTKTSQWEQFFETGKTDFPDLFDGYQSSTDFPGCLMHKELSEQYPGMKFILTLRDPEEWYESVLRTIHAAVPHSAAAKEAMRLKGEASPKFRSIGNALALVEKYLFQRHYAGEFLNKEATISRYLAFQNELRTCVPAQNLLEFRISDGWEPLCAFLGVPVPEEPFPFKNKRKDFQEQIGKMISDGGQLRIK
ncbi:sulfotransferase family protein [Neolewinella aurantiaca]|uniref:Sulfotransferase family protein n=1 Tax=Neolewinella aurantiaca TaxID=2602767 RepID=A0A5C7FQD7_9BACT|nr:sulfotransferase family protein [Neolewinella aurantiaca]TXF88236.1 sulfotransferase family protein [Neolewinella aurantiaca]